MFPELQMDVMTKNQLHQLAELYRKQQDERIIEAITKQAYARVLYNAGNALSGYARWRKDDYMFDDLNKVTPLHVVSACVRLQQLFPDSKVSRPEALEILIEWG